MAIWQVDFYLIGDFPQKSDPNFINSLKPLQDTFGEFWSWSRDIKQYGNVDETCIEIYTKGEVIKAICVRLDMRSLKKHEIEVICEFAAANNFMILCENKEYPPTYDAITSITKDSPAAQYAKDPIGFFKNFKG